MSAETLRKWLRQSEVEAGEAAGVTTESVRQIRELKRKNAEMERTNEILNEVTAFFVSGSATRNAADLRVHCLAREGVRGCTDLPGTGCADYPAHLPGAPGLAAVKAGVVGRRDHRGAGRPIFSPATPPWSPGHQDLTTWPTITTGHGYRR